MADISRAFQTPLPPSTAAPAPQPALPPVDMNAARDAKNERARLRRKAKRAADAKAAKALAAKPKKKKAKRKAPPGRLPGAGQKFAGGSRTVPKKRGRGRPPGAKNKPKDANDILAPLSAAQATPKSINLLTRIGAAVSLINSLPEHARKVVLDAVK